MASIILKCSTRVSGSDPFYGAYIQIANPSGTVLFSKNYNTYTDTISGNALSYSGSYTVNNVPLSSTITLHWGSEVIERDCIINLRGTSVGTETTKGSASNPTLVSIDYTYTVTGDTTIDFITTGSGINMKFIMNITDTIKDTVSSGSGKLYIGVNGIARKVKKMYIGVDGKARKIKKAYIGDANNIARMFFGGLDVATMNITYTGNYTDQDVTMNGAKYRLLTLTSSGTLTLEKSVVGDVWMCGGGKTPTASTTGSVVTTGGDGGYFLQSDGFIIPESIVCTVGAGGSGVSSMDILSSSNGTKGSGGGGAGIRPSRDGGEPNPGSSGGGVSTVPFLETSLFSPHCAGGGGGGSRDTVTEDEETVRVYVKGGSGGSNGSSGGYSNYRTSSSYATGGAGGNKGGGAGGSYSSSTNGSNATYYGSGGGGKPGRAGCSSGSGYQGVIYIRIPYEQGT